ncbi:hypothetical protein AB833_05690 [Chromatiales bacterium (ex Bugula neritina AB1)]|nr:hypothetical protein AB833_05690 [Chromatiales bacterium (ex Bugula neritina AB1)]
MSTATLEAIDWTETATQLGKKFAARAAEHDADNAFVAQNYTEMKDAHLFSAVIPSELGGGGASYSETCSITRTLAQYCGSTALAYAMHCHPVALNVFKYKRGDEKATASLKKIAGGELIIAGTGANDWLNSSGSAEAVDGGFRINARKHFVSGSPGAQVLVTSAVVTGQQSTEVIHFAIPMASEGISHHDNWNTIGMRATGSNDISLENVLVPDAAVVLRRPAGWHPAFNAILPTAMPLIMSAYLGLADAALIQAREAAGKMPKHLAVPLGELINQHTAATLAVDDMIQRNNNHGFSPDDENTSAILSRKTLATEAIKQSVELATEIVGGAAFFKGHPLERITRDVRASHFHPLPHRRQTSFSGRVAMAQPPY